MKVKVKTEAATSQFLFQALPVRWLGTMPPGALLPLFARQG